jgi:hypothetical protein
LKQISKQNVRCYNCYVFQIELYSFESFGKLWSLSDIEVAIIVSSTTGDGEQPEVIDYRYLKYHKIFLIIFVFNQCLDPNPYPNSNFVFGFGSGQNLIFSGSQHWKNFECFHAGLWIRIESIRIRIWIQHFSSIRIWMHKGKFEDKFFA